MIYFASIHLNSAFVHHLLEHVCCRYSWQTLARCPAFIRPEQDTVDREGLLSQGFWKGNL